MLFRSRHINSGTSLLQFSLCIGKKKNGTGLSPWTKTLINSITTYCFYNLQNCIPHHGDNMPLRVTANQSRQLDRVHVDGAGQEQQTMITSLSPHMSSCDGTKPRRRCHKYSDAANTISLLILLTASSSLASSWVSPIDWDARISC